MMRGLWAAATGMACQQTNLDVVANNLANVNTSGFKKSRISFQDLDVSEHARRGGCHGFRRTDPCRDPGRDGGQGRICG